MQGFHSPLIARRAYSPAIKGGLKRAALFNGLNVADYVDISKSSSATFSQNALVKHLGMKLWRVKTALENLKLVHDNYVAGTPLTLNG